MEKLTANEFYRRAREVHGNNYEYDLETFSERLEKVQRMVWRIGVIELVALFTSENCYVAAICAQVRRCYTTYTGWINNKPCHSL